MCRRKLVICGAAFLVATGLAAAAVYTWTGGGANPRWDTCGNWQYRPGLFTKCYPSTDDDAVIPTGTVELIDIGIDDLYVDADTLFQGSQGDPSDPCEPVTLVVDILRIEGAAQHGTRVEVKNCANIASAETVACGA